MTEPSKEKETMGTPTPTHRDGLTAFCLQVGDTVECGHCFPDKYAAWLADFGPCPCNCHKLAALPSAQQQTNNEVAWLIEKVGKVPCYWGIACGRLGFTPLHGEAIRFSRKDDAQNVIAHLLRDVPNLKASGHEWVSRTNLQEKSLPRTFTSREADHENQSGIHSGRGRGGAEALLQGSEESARGGGQFQDDGGSEYRGPVMGVNANRSGGRDPVRLNPAQDEATIEGLRKKVEESQRLTRDILAALEVENLDHLLMRSDDTIVLVVAEITRLTKERIAQLASARARIAELEGDKADE